jgi:hypothetical protein
MKEAIKKILNTEQYYLMYTTGAGGETLVNLISKHSNNFRKIHTSNIAYFDNTNRTVLTLPHLWNIVSSLRLNDYADLDFLVDKVIEVLRAGKHDIPHEIFKARCFIEGDQPPPLLKTHVVFNQYFNNKTYLLVQDTEKWSKYCNYLGYLKMYTTPFNKSVFEYVFTIMEHATGTAHIADRINIVRQYVMTYDIEEMTHAQLEATLLDEGALSCKEALSMKSIDILKMFPYDKFEPSYLSFNASLPQGVKDNYKLLPYSKIFDKGYLEDIFEISGDEFHTSLMAWHNNNVKLLSDNGLQYE